MYQSAGKGKGNPVLNHLDATRLFSYTLRLLQGLVASGYGRLQLGAFGEYQVK